MSSTKSTDTTSSSVKDTILPLVYHITDADGTVLDVHYTQSSAVKTFILDYMSRVSKHLHCIDAPYQLRCIQSGVSLRLFPTGTVADYRKS